MMTQMKMMKKKKMMLMFIGVMIPAAALGTYF